MKTSVWDSLRRGREGSRRLTTMALSGCSSVVSPVIRAPGRLTSVLVQWPQSQIHDPHSVVRSPSWGQAKLGSVPLSHS